MFKLKKYIEYLENKKRKKERLLIADESFKKKGSSMFYLFCEKMHESRFIFLVGFGLEEKDVEIGELILPFYDNRILTQTLEHPRTREKEFLILILSQDTYKEDDIKKVEIISIQHYLHKPNGIIELSNDSEDITKNIHRLCNEFLNNIFIDYRKKVYNIYLVK